MIDSVLHTVQALAIFDPIFDSPLHCWWPTIEVRPDPAYPIEQLQAGAVQRTMYVCMRHVPLPKQRCLGDVEGRACMHAYMRKERVGRYEGFRLMGAAMKVPWNADHLPRTEHIYIIYVPYRACHSHGSGAPSTDQLPASLWLINSLHLMLTPKPAETWLISAIDCHPPRKGATHR